MLFVRALNFFTKPAVVTYSHQLIVPVVSPTCIQSVKNVKAPYHNSMITHIVYIVECSASMGNCVQFKNNGSEIRISIIFATSKSTVVA